MKKFRFRLEKVLQYRSVVKSEKLRELTLANHAVSEIELRIEQIKTAQLENSLEGAVTPEQLQLSGQYGRRLEKELTDAKLALIRAQSEAEKALAAYREAAKEEEALVHLKKKKKAAYIEYIRHEEEKFLDEISVQKGNTLVGAEE